MSQPYTTQMQASAPPMEGVQPQGQYVQGGSRKVKLYANIGQIDDKSYILGFENYLFINKIMFYQATMSFKPAPQCNSNRLISSLWPLDKWKRSKRSSHTRYNFKQKSDTFSKFHFLFSGKQDIINFSPNLIESLKNQNDKFCIFLAPRYSSGSAASDGDRSTAWSCRPAPHGIFFVFFCTKCQCWDKFWV